MLFQAMIPRQNEFQSTKQGMRQRRMHTCVYDFVPTWKGFYLGAVVIFVRIFGGFISKLFQLLLDA